MFCPKCGLEIREGKNFCVLCGTRVETQSNTAPNYQQTETSPKPSYNYQTPQPTPNPSPQYTYKTGSGKWKGFLTLAVIVIAIILIVKIAPSGGDSSLEKALINTLPKDLTTYTYGTENASDSKTYTLEVKEFTIHKEVTNDKSNTAECTIELEDNNIKKTVNVNLYSTKYDDIGWCVDRWAYNTDPIVIPKTKPDKSHMENLIKEYGFNNTTLVEDKLNPDTREYNLIYSVNDVYKYASFSGNISAKAVFTEDYVQSNKIVHYYWSYYSDNNSQIQWNIVGTWELERKVTDQYRSNKKSVFNINSINETDGKLTINGNSIYYSYEDIECVLDCTQEGSTPKDIKLKIKSTEYTQTSWYTKCKGILIFECDSCVGYLDDKLVMLTDDYKCTSITKK